MTLFEEGSNSTTTSTGGNSTCYGSMPSRPVKKRKPVHVVKPASAKQIRESLKISKRDIAIARRIVNNMRHK